MRLQRKTVNTTYKVQPEGDMFVVVAYPMGRGAISSDSFREDALPEWILHHMRILDTAGAGHGIPHIGKKVGKIYWLTEDEDGPFINLLIAADRLEMSVVKSRHGIAVNQSGETNGLRC